MTDSIVHARDAVRYLLTSPSLGGRCKPMLVGDGFDWPALLSQAEEMSGGQRLLVHVAFDLWEAGNLAGIWKLARGLDRTSFERVVTALRLYRGDEFAGSSGALRDAA
jgi:hypothetical protein